MVFILIFIFIKVLLMDLLLYNSNYVLTYIATFHNHQKNALSYKFIALTINSSPTIFHYLFYRYLATGIAFRQIAMSFRVSKTSVSSIVIEVCQAIWTTLRDVHMRKPTIKDFENTADAFYNKWNFPNCIGSIDGKHIRVKCPNNSGSMYYNYKNFFSIVLLAIVDANYRFVLIDIGAYDKDSDSGVST